MAVALKTERLLLRPLSVEDLHTTHSYAGNPENTQYMLHLPNDTLEKTGMFLSDVSNEWAKDCPGFYEFAIVLSNRHIGAVSLYLDESRTEGEFGWVIHRDYRGNGYVTEAALALKDFAVNELKLINIIAHCDTRNAASCRVMEKIGMTLVSNNTVRIYHDARGSAKECMYAWSVHQNYPADPAIYPKMMSTNPVLDKRYFSWIMRIRDGETIKQIDVTHVEESYTSLFIKLSVLIQAQENVYTKKLFIKTVKPNKEDHSYHRMAMREGGFYRFLLDRGDTGLPLPKCYDAYVSEESNSFLLVLEDLSDSHQSPDEASLQDENTWLLCAECLARFHSVFWNHPPAMTNETTIPNRSEQERKANENADRESLYAFLKQYGGALDEKTKLVFEHAMDINIRLIQELEKRVLTRNNITMTHGDSHIHNFMLPLAKDTNPVLTDFQFWGVGIGVGDLAHLTRVNFPDAYKKSLQISLVKHYHQTLLEQGITGYSWENCLSDYRMQAAAMVLIPFWQASIFGVKLNAWIGSVKGLVDNYMLLNCEETYATISIEQISDKGGIR